MLIKDIRDNESHNLEYVQLFLFKFIRQQKCTLTKKMTTPTTGCSFLTKQSYARRRFSAMTLALNNTLVDVGVLYYVYVTLSHRLTVARTVSRRRTTRRRRKKTGADDSLFARLNSTTTMPTLMKILL